MQRRGIAPGKLILSGEYAVVFGYPGIAVPAPFGVTAMWNPSPSFAPARFTLSPGESGVKHHTMTITYSGIESEEYLHRVLDAITAKAGPLCGHLTIKNTIPIGRGMGSSTALVIAMCRCLLQSMAVPMAMCHGEVPRDTAGPRIHTHCQPRIRDIALSIEDTVNPGHSGIDFAVIWAGHPVRFQKKTGALSLPPNSPIHQYTSIPVYWYFIDTGKPNETTAEMIELVKEKVRKNGWSHPVAHSRLAVCHGEVRTKRSDGKPRTIMPLAPQCDTAGSYNPLRIIASCTQRLIAGESPFTVFPDHHRAQVALGVVPLPVQSLITEIEEAGGAAKVVGAGGATWDVGRRPLRPLRGGRTGGGGIVLALHPQPEKLLVVTKRHTMPVFVLTEVHPPLHSRS